MELSVEKTALLRTGLKVMAIQECNVLSVTPSQIDDHETVIGGTGALHLDSLDAVEIVTSIERCFGIRFESPGESRQIFKSFTVMAEYVAEHAAEERVDQFIAKQKTGF